METKLLEIVADILDVELEDITLVSTREEVEEWDSLGMVQLVGEVESEFDCKIPFDEIEKIRAIEDFLKYIA